MTVHQVTDVAKFVSGIYTRPYIVKNSGDNTVYLGQDSSLTVTTRAFSLPAGSTLNWSGTTELWAVTDIGLIAELELLYTGENSFSPGPSTVFAKSASDVVLIREETINYQAGAISGGGSLNFDDVSNYSSVIITLTITPNVGTLAANLNNYIYGSFAFSDISDLLLAPRANAFYNPGWFLCSTEQTIYGLTLPQSIQLPVSGKYLSGIVEFYKAITASAGVIRVQIYGSGEVISQPRYISRGDGLEPGIPNGALYTRSYGGTPVLTLYLESINGDAAIAISATAPPPSAYITIGVAEIGAIVSMDIKVTNPATLYVTTNYKVGIPLRPLVLQITPSGAGSGSIVTITQQ